MFQVTGETTWDRPVSDSQDGSHQVDSEHSFNSEYSEELREQQQTHEKHPLPPDWVALEDPDSGDIYFANEVSGCRVFYLHRPLIRSISQHLFKTITGYGRNHLG